MTHRRALWIAAAGSLLIQFWLIGFWWWFTGGCFCGVGDEPRVSAAAMALADIAAYPIDYTLPRWFTGYHPLTLSAANFQVWFAALFVPLRTWVLIRDVRQPASAPR
jgi:hypothetical protein